VINGRWEMVNKTQARPSSVDITATMEGTPINTRAKHPAHKQNW